MTDNEIAERKTEDAWHLVNRRIISYGSFKESVLPVILSAITAAKQEKEAKIKELEDTAYNVPLCADHAAAWFTERRFKEGDCWFCQALGEKEPASDVTLVLQKACEEAATILFPAQLHSRIPLKATRQNTKVVMQRLVESFTKPIIDFAEWGWTIIANSSGGDWEKESMEWQKAAAKYRDDFHERIRHYAPSVPSTSPALNAPGASAEGEMLPNETKFVDVEEWTAEKVRHIGNNHPMWDQKIADAHNKVRATLRAEIKRLRKILEGKEA